MGARRVYLIVLAGAAGAAVLMAIAAPSAAEKRPASHLWASEGTESAGGTSEGAARGSPADGSRADAGAAREGGDDRLANGGDGLGSSSLLANSLAAVVVILVLGGAALVVLKRLLPKLGVTQGRRIRVVETVYLGARKTLHVVQVGDRTLLLSGTRERLALVADVTGSVDVSLRAPAGAETPRARFLIPDAGAEAT